MKVTFSHASRSGFSLIEITIAMAIAAIAMISILGMLPQTLRMSRDSADQTAIGTLLEDAHDRLEGQPLEAGTPEISPLFYDQQGRFVDPELEVENPLTGGPFFRLDLAIRDVADSVKPGHFEEADDFRAVRMELWWPLQEDGEPINGKKPRVTVSYPITTLTGPDWEQIDPDYIPKIEF